MDQNLDGELSLLDVNSEEQINMDKSPQAPAFSPLTPSKGNFTTPLTPVVAATEVNKEQNIDKDREKTDCLLNLFLNTDMDDESNDNEHVNTADSKEINLKILDENRKFAWNNVAKHMEKMAPLLLGMENEVKVRENASLLDMLFVDMQKSHELYVKELKNKKDVEHANKWYDTHDRDVFNFKKQIVEFLTASKKEVPPTFDTQSHKSSRSGSSYKTQHSIVSSTSTRAKLIAARAKSAALEVRASFLKRKQELRTAAENLDLEQQIAEVKTEQQIYEQELNNSAGNAEVGNLNDCRKEQVNINSQNVQTAPMVLKPNASNLERSGLKVDQNAVTHLEHGSFANVTEISNGQQQTSETHSATMHVDPYKEFIKIQRQQTELTKMIATQQLKNSLPSHKPPIFSGDVMEYPAFITAFDTLVESKVKDPTELLYYLKQYTTGKAKEVIKGCFQRKSESSYTEARALLKKHFGDSFKIANAYVTKLSGWAPIKPNDGAKLQEFAIMLQQAKTAMTGMDYMGDLNTAHVMRQLWEKLPRYLRSKWCERANSIKATNKRVARFEDLVEFVTRQAELATDPIYSEEMVLKDNPSGIQRRRYKGSSFVIGSKEEGIHPSKCDDPPCAVCHKMHNLDQCTEFKKQTLAQRKNFMRMKGMCFGCYSQGHIAKFCKQRKTCLICKKQHPTALHDPQWKPQNKPEKVKEDEGPSRVDSENKPAENRVNNSRATVCDITEAGDTPINMGIIPVWLYHKDNPEHKVAVYALLDSASGGTFIKEETREKLKVKGNDTKLQLTTMHGTKEVDTKVVQGLVVEHFQHDHAKVELPRTYVRQQIPVDRDEIPRTEQVSKWPHLKEVAKWMSAYMEDVEVGILIGLNCPSILRPRDVIHGNDDEPYAVKSLLGWHINGPMKQGTSDGVTCNRVLISTNSFASPSKGYITAQRTVKEIITPGTVKEMFEIEFAERECGKGLSQEDRKFLENAENGIRHGEDMHYEMPLPFKYANIQLPNNRPAAEQRLAGLKRKLQNDDKYRADYVTFMNSVIEKGYARRVEQEEPPAKEGRVWYIPHHGVYHPQKPGKIRVVFDCSAKYVGKSLNDYLLQGPDLTNKLIGVLTRFRQEKVAFMADIEQMFYQVKVKEADQDFLRFLWWPNGDLTKEPSVYRMTVHLFGAASSPGCSNYALKRTADDYEAEFGNEAADTLRRNFYVDDGLKSVPTDEDAVHLVKNLKEICQKGGFNLTKFVSNSVEVNKSIPQEDRARDLKELQLGQDQLPVERALGVHWCIQSDSLKFRIELKDLPCTRRGILSTISSIFDPLGLIAPVVLVGKQILQDICQGSDWDEPVPDDVYAKWERWRSELPLLHQLNVQRSFKPANFGKVVTKQLHSMSDASKTGYGQASYLRLIDENGQIHCSFVAGKARVTPRKTVSIPRLELAAATVSVRVADMLKAELDYKEVEDFYWTDSEVTLGFINNESRRFHVYVANRVQLIRDHTSPQQWRHVGTSSNPTDEASRGMMAKAFLENSKWLTGPDFLWRTKDQWPQQRSDCSVLDSDNPEIKKTNNRTVLVRESNILSRLERFSSWTRAKLAIAHCRRYMHILKANADAKSSADELSRDANKIVREKQFSPIGVKELEIAESVIISWMQNDAFSKEIEVLKGLKGETNCKDRQFVKRKKALMKRASGIFRLDPFLDRNSILRVGGRLTKANISENVKHPIIFPRNGHLTTLLIRHFHAKVQHSGRGITLNELRASGYWVANGNAAVRSVIAKCVKCRHLRGSVGEQKMSNLPESRLEPAPPFTFCAVDYFGPLLVKQGRKEVKRYGALFTCMASRAVHIEVSDSLDTDSFLQALRRFVARRGPVREIHSDRGTNFIGASNELKQAYQEMDDGRIKAELLKNNVDWTLNPPAASHFGGVWERQIKSVRSILSALMKEHGNRLNDEGLRTLLCEAEAIVNSRPLTVETLSDPFSSLPLTPMALLTGKSKVVLPPPGKFQRTDLYCKRRWRQVQHLTNEFWKRWRSEFLQSLQPRQKWNAEKRNFKEGDVVLLKDKDLARNQWPMAKVVDTNADEHGLVRSVRLRMPNRSILERPIRKLILLLEQSSDRESPPREPR